MPDDLLRLPDEDVVFQDEEGETFIPGTNPSTLPQARNEGFAIGPGNVKVFEQNAPPPAHDFPIGQVLGASFSLYNDLFAAAAIAADLDFQRTTPADPDFDVFDFAKDDPVVQRNMAEFIGVTSYAAYQHRRQSIIKREDDGMVAGSGGMFPLLFAAFASPAVLRFFPVNAISRLGRFKQGFELTVAQSVASEIPIIGNLPNRDLGTSVTFMLVGSLLGGTIAMGTRGQALSIFRSRLVDDGVQHRVRTNFERDVREAEQQFFREVAGEFSDDIPMPGGRAGPPRDAQGRTAAEGGKIVDPDAPTSTQSASSAATDSRPGPSIAEMREGEGLVSAAGMDRLPDSPLKRTLNSDELASRETASRLAESPFFQNKNAADAGADATSRSVETNMRKYFWPMVEAIIEGQRQFLQMRGFKKTGSALMDNTLLAVADLVKGRRGKVMGFREFNRQVGRAMQNGDAHAIPEVAAAAKAHRKVVDFLKENGMEADIFTTDLRRQLGLARRRLEELTTPAGRDPDAAAAKAGRRPGGTGPSNARQKMFIEETEEVLKERRFLVKNKKRLEARIDKILKEGPSVTTAKSFFPRIYRHDLILKNLDEFKAILRRHYNDGTRDPAEIEAAVQATTQRILNERPFQQIGDDAVGLARSLRDRQLDIPDHLLNDFVELDAEMVMRYLVRGMSADIELTKMFGSVDMFNVLREIQRNFEARISVATTKAEKAAIKKQMDSDLRDLRAMRDRLRGTFGMPDDPLAPGFRAIRALKQFNFMTMLGGVVIASLPDLARPIMVEGINRTFKNGFKSLFAGMDNIKVAKNELHMAGTALDVILSTRAFSFAEFGDVFGRSSGFERIIGASASSFATISGLNMWNSTMKQWAGMITSARMLDESLRWMDGTIRKGEIAKFTSAGIDEAMARRIAAQFTRHGDVVFPDKATLREILEESGGLAEVWDKLILRARREGGLYLPNTKMWDDLDAVDAFRSALARDVDRTIITPGIGDRPLWMSTPLGSMIGQFKGFSVAAHQRVLTAGLQERNREQLMGAIFLLGIGGMVDHLKNEQRGGHKRDFKTRLVGAFDASGITGYFSDLNRALETLSNQQLGVNPAIGNKRPFGTTTSELVGTVLGPTGSQAVNAARIILGGAAESNQSGSALRRLIPGNNLIPIRSTFDDLEVGFQKAFRS
jgi:hypothetical protein